MTQYSSTTNRRGIFRLFGAAVSTLVATATVLRTATPALAADPRPSMVKIVSILARKDGESVEAFLKHWQEVHAPLVYAVPGVVRYTLSIIESSSTREDGVAPIDLKIDGIAELWFTDQKALDAAGASPAIKKVLADGTLFVGREVDFIAQEEIIIPRRA